MYDEDNSREIDKDEMERVMLVREKTAQKYLVSLNCWISGQNISCQGAMKVSDDI